MVLMIPLVSANLRKAGSGSSESMLIGSAEEVAGGFVGSGILCLEEEYYIGGRHQQMRRIDFKFTFEVDH